MNIRKKRAIQGLDTALVNLKDNSDIYKQLIAIRCDLANAGDDLFKESEQDYESPSQPSYRNDFYLY